MKVYKKLLVLSWCCTVTFSLCFVLLIKAYFGIGKWFVVIQTVFVIFVIVVTYSLIGMKIVHSRRAAVRIVSPRTNRKTLLVSVCIIATYISCYVVPLPITAWLLEKEGSVERNHAIAKSLSCLSHLGSIFNMLIYVLMTNNNRADTVRLCCPYCCDTKRNERGVST